MINTILNNRYQVQKLLREKAGRKTLLALDITTEELVIIKLLIFNDQFLWDDLKLFEREAQILKLLTHPAIPKYVDYFELDLPNLKGFALVQTHLDAPSLQKSFEDGRRFNEQELKEIAHQLLAILQYLHSHNPPVIHRDIKPSNILLTNRSGNRVGEIFLVDFGSVQNVLAHDEGTITIVGTYGYMPIEQFSGQTLPASDLYSLGATLIYLVTGKHPSQLLKNKMRITFDNNSNLSDAFIDWLNWLTEPSLDVRIESASKAIAILDKGIIRGNTLTQPLNSKVIISNTPHKLDIIIPPRKLEFSLLENINFEKIMIRIMILVLGIVPLILGILSMIIGGRGAFFILSAVTVSVILIKILNFFKEIRLTITPDNLQMIKKSWGLQYQIIQVFTKQVTAIEHTCLSSTTDSFNNQIEIYPQLCIWIGIKKIMFVEEKRLSAPELHWLAQEISDFLKVPILRD